MAFAFRLKIAGRNFAGGSSWSDTTASDINSGDLLCLQVGCDNLDSSDGETSVVSSVSVGGQALTKLREYTNGQGAAGSGATCSVWFFQNSAAVASGGAIEVVFAGSIAADRAKLNLWAFTMDNGQTLTEADHAFSVGDGSTEAGDITLSGLVSSSYLFLRLTSLDTFGGTTGQSSGWTALAGVSFNNSAGGEYHIVTATTDTSTQNVLVAGDSASVMLALSEGTPGGATDVFFENRHSIEFGIKPSTAAGMGGVLIE